MKRKWPSKKTIIRFNNLTSEQQVTYVKRKVSAMKPESTGEAKGYFQYVWDRLLKHSAWIPTIYYGNTRG